MKRRMKRRVVRNPSSRPSAQEMADGVKYTPARWAKIKAEDAAKRKLMRQRKPTPQKKAIGQAWLAANKPKKPKKSTPKKTATPKKARKSVAGKITRRTAASGATYERRADGKLELVSWIKGKKPKKKFFGERKKKGKTVKRRKPGPKKGSTKRRGRKPGPKKGSAKRVSTKARKMAAARRRRRPAAYKAYKTWGSNYRPRKIRKLKRGRKTRGAYRGVHAVRRAHRTLWRAKSRGPKASRRYMTKNRIKVGRRPNFIGGIIQGIKAAAPAAVAFVGAKVVGGFVSGLATNVSNATVKKLARPVASAALLALVSTLAKKNKLPKFISERYNAVQVGLGVALIHDVASMLLGSSSMGSALGMAATGEYVTTGDYIDTGAYIDTGDYVDVGDVAELDAGQGQIPHAARGRLLPGQASAHAQVNRWAPTQEDELYVGVFGGQQRLGVGQ